MPPDDGDDIIPVDAELPSEDEDELPEPGPLVDPEETSSLRKCRRFVSVTQRVRVGRGVKLFAYGYADLSALLAMTEPAIRQAVRRGSFDPGDLRSVFEFLLSRLGDRKVRERLLGPMPGSKP